MAELTLLNGLVGGLVATIVMTAFMMTLGAIHVHPTGHRRTDTPARRRRSTLERPPRIPGTATGPVGPK